MKRTHGGDIYSFDRELLDFSVSINPLGIPERAYNKLLNTPKVLSNYPDISCRALKTALSEKEGAFCDNIICGNGASEIIYTLGKTLQPKKTLIIAPTFSEYEQALANSEIIYYYLKEDNDFSVNRDILDIIKNVNMAFICNPNNPTGQSVDRKLISEILAVAKENNVFLAVDECFIDFAVGNNSLVSEINNYKNLFVIKAFTKIYSMAGVRLGYGISSNKELLINMEKNMCPWNVSAIAQLLGVEVLKEEDFIDETRKYISQERQYLVDNLSRLNIKVYNSEANFLLLKSDIDLYNRLLIYNILIRKCDDFKGLGKNYYRIGIKNHSENQSLINALEKIMEDR